MRFALVIEPASGSDSLDRIAPFREAVGRAGFNLVRLHTGANLAHDLARAIAVTDDEDAALVYFAGDVRLGAAQGGPEAELAGESPVSFAEIARTLAARKLAQLLFVVDARVEGEPGDAMHAFEHVEAIVRGVAPKEHAMELLVAVESGPIEAPPSLSLTRFFIQAIEDPDALAPDGTMHMSRAYAKMTDHPEFASTVPSFAHVKGPSDFTVVAPVTERVSEPPSSRASAPSSVVSSRTPSRARPVMPMPAIEPILADAERAHKEGHWDAALDGYRKALMLIGEGQPTTMASLYASVAEVKLAQGKEREAEANYEKALAADPMHARSLTALTKRAIDAKDWRRAAALERRLARSLTEEGQQAKRIETYARAAELYEDANDLRTAVEVLEEARAIRPNEPALLSALRAGYEALRQWKKLVELLGVMAEAAPLLHDKAQRRFEQADVVLGRLRDEEVGLAVLASALEEDPTHERALAAIVAVHTRREEWRDIEALYQKLVGVFAHREDAARAWEICKRLGQLRRDKLGDGPGALDAFTAAVKLRPKDVETRAALAELLVAKGDREAAIAELEIAARFDPARAETHRRLFELHRRTGATDRAWLAATALEALGAANADQGMLASQFRGEGRPTTALDDAAWSLLRAPGNDSAIQAITEAVAPSAVRVKLEELRAERKLVLLDLEKRQPPTSTATLVRTFGMVGDILGVKPPDLYAYDAVDGGLAAVQAEEPSTVFGPSLTNGRKLPELAFAVARHLVYYRPEHYVLLFYPTLAELTALVLAAIKVARPELPLPISPLSVKLRRELAKHTTEAQKSALAIAVEHLDARGGKLDLAAWLVGVELTANRAGLLLAGDLAVALSMMRGESRSIAELTFEDRRADLIAFTASRALAELRAKLGIAATAALSPPPPSTRVLPPS
jgi:tetratricopeptide (TPR) repeat protein